MALPSTSPIQERRRIFRALVPYFGTVQPASFFRDTSAIVKGVTRIHPLIEGIYKPAGSTYPLSIASMLKSRYGDQLFHNPDRTWWMQYSPKAGGMDLAVNAGLVRCMTDREPLLVLRQESDKASAVGARHLLLGLGYVENFDPSGDLFRVRGLTFDEVSTVTGTALSEESDELIETALRLESLEEWVPFAAERSRSLQDFAAKAGRCVSLDCAIKLQSYVCCHGSAFQVTSACRSGWRSHHRQRCSRN